MEPLSGMVVVAEFGDHWDAHLAAARLLDQGYEATVVADPARHVAPHHVTDRRVRVLVRAEVADRAAELLDRGRPDPEAEALDALYHERRFADRPTWIRWATWALLVAIPGPIVLAGLILGAEAILSMFP